MPTVKETVLLIILFVLLLTSSLGVIYSKHLSRQGFAQLQTLQRERDALHVEWTQLLLEQGALATHARVDRIARDTLHMTLPLSKQVEVIR
jgi:cell division protein FtsL